MSDTAGLMRCIAIEIAHGGNRALWHADDVTDEDLAAFALAGVKPEQARAAAEAKQPFVPKYQPPARRAKRYRDMDDNEFDDTWNEERGSQAGIPL